MRKQPDKSSLFLVRIWTAEEDLGGLKWCGKVQHVISGEARPFADWSELEVNMLKMLQFEAESEAEERGQTPS
jgi:hypothetical protein